MSLCLATAAVALPLALQAFTLAWTHSVEKTEWRETWRVEGRELVLAEGRVRGSGAGMDPPEGAWLDHGVWHYRLADPWRERVVLARSPYVRDYDMCIAGACAPLHHWIPVSAGTITPSACARPDTAG